MTARRSRQVPFLNKPLRDPAAEAWVRQVNGDDTDAAGISSGTKAEIYTARLTLDVTPELRGRIKIAAFRRSSTVADMLRALLEVEYPEEGGP